MIHRFQMAPLILAVLAAAIVTHIRMHAAAPIPDLVHTAGTTTRDAQARDWAYVLWSSDDPALLAGQAHAIYAKAGDANSSAPYQRRSIARWQSDPAAIAVLIQRAVNLGEDLPTLEQRTTEILSRIQPPPNTSLADRLSLLIRSAQSRPTELAKLLFMARLHPAVALCLGIAYAEPITGVVTYEIRRMDTAKDQELGVIGRVTLIAGSPLILPAPGPAVLVPEYPRPASSKGHLNAKFRWVVPAPLRRLELLSQGFDLYRVQKDYADARNWAVTPPARGILAQQARALSGNPASPGVRLVNALPILRSRDFEPGDVDPVAGPDHETYFAEDNNNRHRDPSLALRNGDMFYYFVAARDILGRNGTNSTGTLVTVCDRLPPEAPIQVEVDNFYQTTNALAQRQGLRVAWRANPANSNETLVRYDVYRWPSVDLPMRDNLLSGPSHPNWIRSIIAAPGQTKFEVWDNGPGAPALPQNADGTFWYTVRAIDDGACHGGNASPHGGPIAGVLHDRDGPGAVAGLLSFQCCQPIVAEDGTGTVELSGGDTNFARFALSCRQRGSTPVEWAEFYSLSPQPSNLLRRAYFGGLSGVIVTQALPRTLFTNRSPVFFCRAGLQDGRVSDFALNAPGLPGNNLQREVRFMAENVCQTSLVSSNAAPCGIFDPRPPGSLTNQCIGLTLSTPASTRTVRLYKSVNGSPPSLFDELFITNNPVSRTTDCAVTPVAAEICYYAQPLDVNGNPGPLSRIACVMAAGATPLQAPLLAQPEPGGDATSPLMTLRWFCPPYGVERFEVSLARADAEPLPSQLSSLLLPKSEESSVPVDIGGASVVTRFSVYPTRATREMAEGADFRVTVPVALNRRYVVFIRSRGIDGRLSERSSIQQFSWDSPLYAAPTVPWPARPLPPVVAASEFRSHTPIPTTGIVATNLLSTLGPQYPLGVRVGDVFGVISVDPDIGARIVGTADPVRFLYRKENGDALFPLVLYRCQAPNVNFPEVSGDLIQVSPWMERLAFARESPSPGVTNVVLRDPFVAVTHPRPEAGHGLYLLDTQPALAGARYVYILVRFDPRTREIAEVIATNEVDL